MKFNVIFNTQLRVLRLPAELGEWLGLDLDASEELPWQDLVVEDAATFLPDAPGKTFTKVAYLKRASGEILEASFACERLERSPDLIHVEVTLSEAGELQGAEAVDKDSLDFLTTVSHELRVALNGVIGFANVLGGTDLDVNQLAILEKLQSCNHMLKGLINDILEYSRVATAKIHLKTETVDLDEFVREVAGLFRDRARKKGLDLQVDVAADACVVATLPRMRVTQVLSNLIANAIKFTDVGWVRVAAFCEDGDLCIEVEDTGPGVDSEVGESIFQPFYRLKEQEGAPEGTGLGLAISKELAGKMGGTLRLKQPNEAGCLFEFRLPLNESQQGAGEPPEPEGRVVQEPAADLQARSGDKRVLVVEDNQLNADILGHFLQDYGVAYDHVDNGREAVNAYRDGKYDLILMDVMLPEMNGYEATEKILAQSRRSSPVPIVGVTAKVFRRDQMRCIEAGMVEVVHKPVDFKQLRAVLDNRLYSNQTSAVGQPKEPGSERSNGEDRIAAKEGDFQFEKGVAAGGRDCMDAGTLEAYIDRMKTPDTSRIDIVNTAISIIDAEVKSLLESIDSGDRKDVGMRAHSLKGALALLGARNILDLAKGLELIASDGRSPLKSEHWKQMLEGSYAEFRGQLEAYMQTTVVE
ncbi:response regulator [Pelagicoccus enzymogenes]|uniref:sensor histidine kinase n=1 Tax=Pelagicoccus enzymogenes TaxID=2773457 RepID=UPI00280FFBDC|nr:ATP-binding protein [Pelagicoccus enzymogenes]MDQ8201156.1 response regulator [Pelagicoccus enzymogenes]